MKSRGFLPGDGQSSFSLGGRAPVRLAKRYPAERESAAGQRVACVVDLTGVSFLDSAGLTALLQAAVYTEARWQRLPIVVDSNRPVIRPIEVTGLDDSLALYHTVDEAFKAGKPAAP